MEDGRPNSETTINTRPNKFKKIMLVPKRIVLDVGQSFMVKIIGQRQLSSNPTGRCVDKVFSF